MHVVFVSSEVAPYSNSGTLGEVTGQLAPALQEAGTQVTVITPFYRGIDPLRFGLARRLRTVSAAPVADDVGLLDGKFVAADVATYMVDHPQSFDRDGLYGEGGVDYPDNAERSYALCAAALSVMEDLEFKPDLIHCHDWQTGLVPFLLRTQPDRWPSLAGIKVLFSVHNQAFAGLFPAEILDRLELGRDLFNPDGIEFHGRVSLLKAGLVCADGVAAPGRGAVEEMCSEEFGFGFEGLFRHLEPRMTAITGGVDPAAWNPEKNHRLASTYTAEKPFGKTVCKSALQRELGLPVQPRVPLLVMPGTISVWRGAGLVLDALAQLPDASLQVAFLGPVEAQLQGKLDEILRDRPAQVVYRTEVPKGDDEHRLLAGADGLLMPSRHEPSALLHLRALRYGAVPIARRSGVFRDTLVDFDQHGGTGTAILFDAFDASALLGAIRRATQLFNSEGARAAVIANTMTQDHSWARTAGLYTELYGRLTDAS